MEIAAALSLLLLGRRQEPVVLEALRGGGTAGRLELEERSQEGRDRVRVLTSNMVFLFGGGAKKRA